MRLDPAKNGLTHVPQIKVRRGRRHFGRWSLRAHGAAQGASALGCDFGHWPSAGAMAGFGGAADCPRLPAGRHATGNGIAQDRISAAPLHREPRTGARHVQFDCVRCAVEGLGRGLDGVGHCAGGPTSSALGDAACIAVVSSPTSAGHLPAHVRRASASSGDIAARCFSRIAADECAHFERLSATIDFSATEMPDRRFRPKPRPGFPGRLPKTIIRILRPLGLIRPISSIAVDNLPIEPSALADTIKHHDT